MLDNNEEVISDLPRIVFKWHNIEYCPLSNIEFEALQIVIKNLDPIWTPNCQEKTKITLIQCSPKLSC